MSTSDPPQHSALVFGQRTGTRTVLEATLEEKFRLAVRRLGGRVWKLAPTTKGVPDRLVFLPEGRVYVVELKTEAGTVSPKQQQVHDQLAEVGTLVHVIYGQAGVADWVAAHTV